MHYRSMRDELEGLPKIAVGILGALGHGLATGVAGHVGANVVGMAGHHGNIGEIMAHRGLQHALTGSKMNPAAEFSIKHLFGPEALSGYHAAHAAGAKLKDLPTDQMRAALAAGTVGSHPLPSCATPPSWATWARRWSTSSRAPLPSCRPRAYLASSMARL